MEYLHSPLVTALGAAVLHSFWQATLLAILLWLSSRYLRIAPNRRYWLGFTILFLQLGASLITLRLCYEPAYGADFFQQEFTDSATLVFVNSPTFSSENAYSLPPSLYIGLAVLWGLGLLFGSLRLLFGHFFTNFFYRRSLRTIPEGWQVQVNRLASALNLTGRNFRVQLSSRVKSPALIGLFKPLILLPIAMVNQLSPAQVEAVLAHELSHLAHRDHWWNLLQSLIEVLFYFNPAVHWISRQIRDEREYRCDQRVRELGIDPLQYAKTLFLLEEQRQLSPHLALAARPGSLLGRVQHLLQNTPNHYRMKPGLLLGLLLLVTTFFSFSATESAPDPLLDNYAPVVVVDHNDEASSGHYTYHHQTNAGASHVVRQQTTSERTAGPITRLDTVPPSNYRSRQQITTFSNGRQVEIEKIDGKVTKLAINGKVIPPEEYPKYQSIIDQHTRNNTFIYGGRNNGKDYPVTPPAPPTPPGAPAPPAPPTPPTPGEHRNFHWEHHEDGAEGHQSLQFEMRSDDEDNITMFLPGTDSVMVIRPGALSEGFEAFTFPDFDKLLEGTRLTDEENDQLREQLEGMRDQLLQFRSFNDDIFFFGDSTDAIMRLFGTEGENGFRLEFNDDDVFEFNGDGIELDGNGTLRFDSDEDLERLRDNRSSSLFGKSNTPHKISSDKFLSLVKDFQGRGLIKDGPIKKFTISDKKMKINGKKVSDDVFNRFYKEYEAKYGVSWFEDIGSFEISVNN
ncbi:MAG: M56 family metallopeptidase [Bacteroidota bacterium]